MAVQTAPCFASKGCSFPFPIYNPAIPRGFLYVSTSAHGFRLDCNQSPPAGKKDDIFIDDLNLPKKVWIAIEDC